MKKVCFLTSHVCSGSSYLFDILDQNPRVQGFRLGRPYVDMMSVMDLASRRHKLNNSAAIYMDELLYNYFLQTKDVYKYCQFIYLIRPPEPTLNEIVSRRLYTAEKAMRYYCYRLQRISEMAARTGGVLLMWDDVVTGRGFGLVEEYLGLKQNLVGFIKESKPITSLVSLDLLDKANECFEGHISFLYKQKSLLRWK